MKEFIISKKQENKQIYSVLQKQFPHMSNASLNKAFRLKDVKVNDIRVTKDFIVKNNDVVKIYLTDNILFGLSPKISYAYEDENILIAYKPKGVVSNYEGLVNLKNNLVPYFDELVIQDKKIELKICHRLDTNTEGLVIFAKNDSSYLELLNAFKDGQISKEYLTLVYGKLPKNNDTLSHYILKDEKTGFSKIVDKITEGAKPCITEYNLVKYFKSKNCSIAKIALHTGRTHQIRAHMKYLGNPVVGDSKYSTNEINNKFKIYSQVLFAVKYTFNFDNNSCLSYLNNKIIDISSTVLEIIEQIINN